MEPGHGCLSRHFEVDDLQEQVLLSPSGPCFFSLWLLALTGAPRKRLLFDVRLDTVIGDVELFSID